MTLAFGAGVLVLECGYIVHIVKMHFFPSKSTLLLGVDKTNSAYSNDEQERVYQTYKFMTPIPVGSDGRGHTCISHIVKCNIAFKILTTFRNRLEKLSNNFQGRLYQTCKSYHSS